VRVDTLPRCPGETTASDVIRAGRAPTAATAAPETAGGSDGDEIAAATSATRSSASAVREVLATTTS